MKKLCEYLMAVCILTLYSGEMSSQSVTLSDYVIGICAGETKTVTASSSESSCFFWTANPPDPNLESQKNNPSISVSSDMSRTYSVQALASDFSWCGFAQVDVNVGEFSTTISTEKCCWNNGDEIFITDFQISTSPPGFENRVSFSDENPPVADNDIGSSSGEQNILFNINQCSGESTEHTETISVVNEGLCSELKISLNQFPSKLGEIQELLETIKDAVEGYSLLSPGASCNFSTGVQLAPITIKSCQCCSGEFGCAEQAFSFKAAPSVNMALNCDFVVPIGTILIPITGDIEATANCSVELAGGCGDPLCAECQIILLAAGGLGGEIPFTGIRPKAQVFTRARASLFKVCPFGENTFSDPSICFDFGLRAGICFTSTGDFNFVQDLIQGSLTGSWILATVCI